MIDGCTERRPRMMAALTLGLLARMAARYGGLRRSWETRSFQSLVRRHIEATLETGPNLDEIASELGCSRQTLYRRLKAEGATFAALVEDVRHRKALHHLRRERLSVKETAYRLGFSDPSAFSRAFKRWTGVSPNSVPGSRS